MVICYTAIDNRNSICSGSFYHVMNLLGLSILSFPLTLFIYFYVLILERRSWGETQRQKHQSVIPLIYALIGCLLYVLWREMEHTTLANQDNTLTNSTTGPGPPWLFIFHHFFLILKKKIPSCDCFPKHYLFCLSAHLFLLIYSSLLKCFFFCL